MPTFRITAPDGAKYNVTGPDGATEQDALAQVQAQHQPNNSPSPETRAAPSKETTGESIVRGIGQGAEAGLEGLGSVYDLARIPANAIAGAVGLPASPSAHEIIRAHSPFPEPQGIDAVTSDMIRGTTAGVANLATGSALAQAASPVVAGIGQVLTKNPIAQAAGFGTSEVARGATERAGGGPVAQIAASVAGGLPGFAAASKLEGALARAPEAIAAQPAAPITAADLRKQASNSYAAAASAGGALKPSFTNNFIDHMSSNISEPERVTQAFGKNPVQDIVEGISGQFRDTPITLQEANGIDKRLGDAIEKSVNPKTGKLDDAGRQLYNFQGKFRDMIAAAEPEDIIGGKDGFDSLVEGRQLWAKSARAGDIERILSRAELMDNPATSIRAGFRTLLNSPRINGFSPAEQALIKRAASNNLSQEALRLIGSRLTAIGSTVVGQAVGGIPGALVSGGLATIAGKGARELAGRMQGAQGQKVIDSILGNTPAASSPLLGNLSQNAALTSANAISQARQPNRMDLAKMLQDKSTADELAKTPPFSRQ